MLYFFHHFELPVIEAQLLHIFVDQNILTQPTNNERNDRDDNTVTTTS